MLKLWTEADERAALEELENPQEVTYFAAHNDSAIHGIGTTVDAALFEAEDGLEPGQKLADLELEVLPCTAALAAEIKVDSDVEWHTLPNGVICTRAEFDEEMGVSDGELLL